MTVRPIVQLGNPLLRQVAKRVEDPSSAEILELVQDLADTLAEFQRRTGYGRGIAAPQIGVLRRVVYVHPPGDEPLALCNPEIVWHSGETFTVWDACFSYFTLFFQVERARGIRVRFQDLSGCEKVIEASGSLSELLQHEIDHLDGRLAIDLVTDPRSFCTVAEYERRHRHIDLDLEDSLPRRTES